MLLRRLTSIGSPAPPDRCHSTHTPSVDLHFSLQSVDYVSNILGRNETEMTAAAEMPSCETPNNTLR